MNTSMRRDARGFSLIEVMIAVVVLSFGLLALAALQASLFRAGAESKARANATAIAQAVVEDAKTFAFLTPPSASYPVADTYAGLATANLGSQEVGSNTFHACRQVWRYRSAVGATTFSGLDATAAEKTASPASVSGGSVSMAGCTTTAGSLDTPGGGVPEFKEVRVTVAWLGADGQLKSVALTDTVAAIAPADAIQVVKGPFEASRGPEVWIEPPNKDNPAVVPIAVGDDKSAASSNPVPRRFSKVDDNTAATLFSVLTFTGSTTGQEVLLNRKLDVAGVTCRCSTGSGTTYASSPTNPAFQPTVWNGKQLAYMEPQPLPTGTKIGLFEDKGSSAKDIEAMCDTCCRDHHESASRNQRPDPHRALTASENNGAEHYLFSNLTSPISSGIYSEACQLIRVAGRMRISVDPMQNFLVTVPLNDAKTGQEPANFVERYSSLVVDYLQSSASALPTGYLSPTAPFPAFVESRYSCKDTGDTSCDPGYSDILDPAPIYLAKSATKQLVSFGLYVDYINADTKKAYDCALSKSTSSDCDGLRDRNALETLPFYAINVANLGVWSVDVNGKEWLTVTSPAFANNTGILQGDGGVVKADSSKVSANPNNCGFVNLDISRSSSGIAGRLPIDPHDNAAANKARDVIAFTSSTTTTSCK